MVELKFNGCVYDAEWKIEAFCLFVKKTSQSGSNVNGKVLIFEVILVCQLFTKKRV